MQGPAQSWAYVSSSLDCKLESGKVPLLKRHMMALIKVFLITSSDISWVPKSSEESKDKDLMKSKDVDLQKMEKSE